MILATWGPRALSDALADAKAALAADGVEAMRRLVVIDLLMWCLQRDPANRPQSCAELLTHRFFANGGGEEAEEEGVEEVEGGVEEAKGEGKAEVV